MFFIVFFTLSGVGVPLFLKFILETNPFMKSREEDFNNLGMGIAKDAAKFFGLPMMVKNSFYQASRDCFLFPLSGFFLFATHRDLYYLTVGVFLFPLWSSAGILFYIAGVVYQLARDIFFILWITFEFLEQRKRYSNDPITFYMRKVHVYTLKFILREILTLEFVFSRQNPRTVYLQKYTNNMISEYEKKKFSLRK